MIAIMRMAGTASTPGIDLSCLIDMIDNGMATLLLAR